jgi:hypothetical protein
LPDEVVVTDRGIDLGLVGRQEALDKGRDGIRRNFTASAWFVTF